MRLLILITIFSIFLNIKLTAQSPSPALPQAGSILILGGTAHLGTGQSIENAAIAFEKGKLTMVADANTSRIDRNSYTSIFDANGKDIYPGFIAMNSNLGLVEINAVRSTRDFDESGSINPSVRAIIAYNTDSDVTPTVRSNGVLMAQVCPEGGLLSGKSALVQLDAWNWEDAALKTEDGLHLNWPNPMKWTGWEEGKPRQTKNENYEKNIQELKSIFQTAKAYALTSKPMESNLKMEALSSVLDKNQNLYIHVNAAKQMQEAVIFAEEMGCTAVLVGADDAFLIADFLKKYNTAVILNPSQSLPSRTDDQVFQPYETPKVLQEAGVLFAIAGEGSWQQRNLPFQVGQAVSFGLPYEAGINAVTSNPAKIMGLENQIGTLEVGKDATLFISEGDVLDMATSRVIAAFIQGRSIDLDDKHKQLYHKFKSKYQDEKD